MKDLTMFGEAKTMSSVELVKIINDLRDDCMSTLEHSDFLKKVVKVLGKDAGNFSGIYKDAMNRNKPCYYLPKREAHLMVMSENYKVQAAVYDRMVELEEVKPIDPMLALGDPAVLRVMLLSYLEAVIAKDAQIAVLEPQAAALKQISGADGCQCVTDTAKALSIQPKKLFEWLKKNSWIYKRPGGKNWLGYSDKIKTGLVDHKMTVVSRGDGSEKTAEQVLITPKGITKLAEIFSDLNKH